ncbi:MAG TPA: hypothetical protein H9717_10535 [Candidatus Eisenbergiella merdipullorum]|uniref:Uncharacterized protein n=1 Tax=Candidatus Eisenbergiella merdipullorum TaxID=2838553 RepID=A0A9D2I584_9FIRM|nr:hypothetical protein [Candidatus Eisenbergiella merdipullorum]
MTGHDGKQGLKRNAEDLTLILENLGVCVRQIIVGERVWQKGEVIGTKAMEEAWKSALIPKRCVRERMLVTAGSGDGPLPVVIFTEDIQIRGSSPFSLFFPTAMKHT